MAAVLKEFDSDGRRSHLLPALMARACVAVLPVAGAGLSFTDELRIPLGASDETAARAERLQTTLGEGPCLAATAASAPLQASSEVIANRWPLFHRELLRQTPYRAVASFPLQSNQHRRFGALDLYALDGEVLSDLMLDQITIEIADPIAAILFDGPAASYPQTQNLPDWLASDAVMDRMTVWSAVGLLMEEAVLTNAEALARLRGYAFAHDITLDALADRLVTHQVSPRALLSS